MVPTATLDCSQSSPGHTSAFWGTLKTSGSPLWCCHIQWVLTCTYAFSIPLWASSSPSAKPVSGHCGKCGFPSRRSTGLVEARDDEATLLPPLPRSTFPCPFPVSSACAAAPAVPHSVQQGAAVRAAAPVRPERLRLGTLPPLFRASLLGGLNTIAVGGLTPHTGYRRGVFLCSRGRHLAQRRGEEGGGGESKHDMKQKFIRKDRAEKLTAQSRSEEQNILTQKPLKHSRYC